MARPRPTVFLIDSDEETRVTHETILRTDGYEILSAPDGAQALEQVREQPPNLILAGVKIGRMSPVQLIRLLKTDEMTRSICVGAFVPGEMASMKEDLARAGADAVFVLPMNPQELVREVVGLIGRA